MKKTFIFLMMCILGGLIPLNVMAQETVTIGDGQKDSQYVPFNANADGSISQTYYLKSEIGEANKGKTITAISYKQKSGKSPFSHEIEIYMVNTESTNAGGVTMAKLNSSDLVYSGEVEFRIDEWVSITLDTPFSYTGDNILVCVNDKYIESYASPAPKFYCYSTDAYKTLYKSNTSYFMTRETAVNNIFKMITEDSKKRYKSKKNTDFSQALATISLFGISAEELSEAGVPYENLKALGSAIS